jgi:hypothetical protein
MVNNRFPTANNHPACRGGKNLLAKPEIEIFDFIPIAIGDNVDRFVIVKIQVRTTTTGIENRQLFIAYPEPGAHVGKIRRQVFEPADKVQRVFPFAVKNPIELGFQAFLIHVVFKEIFQRTARANTVVPAKLRIVDDFVVPGKGPRPRIADKGEFEVAVIEMPGNRNGLRIVNVFQNRSEPSEKQAQIFFPQKKFPVKSERFNFPNGTMILNATFQFPEVAEFFFNAGSGGFGDVNKHTPVVLRNHFLPSSSVLPAV